MLRLRLIIAFAIIVPLVGVVVADFRFAGQAPGWLLFPLGAAVAVLASGEVIDMVRSGGHQLSAFGAYAGTAMVWLASAMPLYWPLSGSPYPPNCPMGKLGWPLLALAVSAALTLSLEMRRFQEPGSAIVRAALSLFVVVYVGFLSSFFVWLRMFEGNEWGMTALLSVIVIAKLADTGAYATGKLFGKRKMAPRLSPGKTVEGAVGGLIAACLASCVFLSFLPTWLVGPEAEVVAWWRAALYGLVIGTAGVLGDLSESLLKRDMQRKDSSAWMPGLGGVLDIVDSLLFAAPAAYLCWVIGLVGPHG